MVELAVQADALGFEGIMGADHGFVPETMENGYLYSEDGAPPISGDMPYPDVWTTIGAMPLPDKLKEMEMFAEYLMPLLA